MYPITASIAARAEKMTLTAAEKTRYSRHLLLPEVGLAGQLRLKASRVLVVGLGGLGAPASLYLSAAGVGTLGLADCDQVEVSNLQRQVLYTEADVGADKVATTAARLGQLNSATVILQHRMAIDASNAESIVADYDLVLDGTDNFGTRYLLNDTCVLLGKPYIYGSILRFAGQASVFYPPHGPCYRCLFPYPPALGMVPSCAEGGVLGVLPGQIGSIQATEALKMLLGIGTTLLGRLLTLDALTMNTSEFILQRDTDCPACGTTANIRSLSAGYTACTTRPQDLDATNEPDSELSVEEFHKMRINGLPYTLVDVRSAAEYAICHIDGSLLIPLDELAPRLAQLPSDRSLIVHCKAGPRSRQAVKMMRQMGLKQARSLNGGILAWAKAYDQGLALY